MARPWLSIRVELVGAAAHSCGRAPDVCSRPPAAHTFADLATAIDDAFARWDRAHLHEFRLADGTRLTTPYGEDDELGPWLDDRRTRLSRLRPGEQFLYTFDLGDNWTHLCTVGVERIDPLDELGIVPAGPLPSGAGARSPTSTSAAGTATTASTTRRPTHAARTCHRCGADGGVPPAVEQEAAGHRRPQIPQRARRTWSARTATAQLARWPAERGVYGR